MAQHIVSTLSNGHVRVVTTDGAAEPVHHEYFRIRDQVYLLPPPGAGASILAYKALGMDEAVLTIRAGETLEDTVRSALAQSDGVEQAPVFTILRDWILCALGLSLAAAGASVLGTCSVALVAFAGWAAVVFQDPLAATVALTSAVAFTLAVLAIGHLRQGFPKWKKLVGGAASTTVVITFLVLTWWGGPHINFIAP